MHTPGDWTAGEYDDGRCVYVWNNSEALRPGSRAPAKVLAQINAEDMTEEECKGNSLLFAAAPDLLAALQAFVDYYDQAGMPDDLTPEYEEEADDGFDGFDGDEVFNVRIGRAAIAKATTKPKE